MQHQIVPNSSYYIIKRDDTPIVPQTASFYTRSGDLLQVFDCLPSENYHYTIQRFTDMLDPKTIGKAQPVAIHVSTCAIRGRVICYYDKNGNRICMNKYGGLVTKEDIVSELFEGKAQDMWIDWEFVNNNNILIIQ